MKKLISNLTILFCMFGMAMCCQSCEQDKDEPANGKVKADVAGDYVIQASEDLLHFFDVVVEYGENSNLNNDVLTSFDFNNGEKLIPFSVSEAPSTGMIKVSLIKKFNGQVDAEKENYKLSLAVYADFTKIEVNGKRSSVIDNSKVEVYVSVDVNLNGIPVIDANEKLNNELESIGRTVKSVTWWVDENAEYERQ